MMNYVKSTFTGQVYKINFDVSNLKGYEPATESEYLAYCKAHNLNP